MLKDGAWAQSLPCLTSAPGIGLVTAAWLLVGTLHFTLCAGPDALTAYAGLAPVLRESGRSVRGRSAIGHDGNGRLRTALYMATLSAARKLLHLAWALGTNRQRFNPDHEQQQHAASPQLAA